MSSPVREKSDTPARVGGLGPQLVAAGEYTCPMHPEIRQKNPGTCPKCGMALEPVAPSVPATKTEYTCPMHPQIVCSEPGNCPICGMTLEPRTVTAEPEDNAELAYMSRRFWVGVALTIPLLVIALSE
jgi:Cu+-exporting ATPase